MTHKRSWQRPIKDQNEFDSEYARLFGDKFAEKRKKQKRGHEQKAKAEKERG